MRRGAIARWVAVSTIALFLLAIPTTGSGSALPVGRFVSERRPVLGPGREVGGSRAAALSSPVARQDVGATANPWQLEATLPGAVIKDMSFATPRIGYIAAELGQVWKTTDGGATWSRILNLGFPYYWYGVDALTPTDVVISGFNNSNFQGILRWSHDGGASWSADVVLTTDGWSFRVRFADQSNGLVLDGLNLDAPNAAHWTSTGGQTAGDWTETVPDPDGGWFGNQFSLLPNLRAGATGITACDSPNGGAMWMCRSSIDPVFDGATYFVNSRSGWVGGGTISPTVEGWVHRTDDGGATWSGRTLHSPWPVREIRFVTPRFGWAAGGDAFSSVGGLYFSRDGGRTWSLDLDSGAEMAVCDHQRVGLRAKVWCAGYTSTFDGVVYSLETPIQDCTSFRTPDCSRRDDPA